ncbi:MAG: hypothetical protein ONB16_03060 [candidate division KSB1 bacterium]|nr:hypothetical protein [candidate division KSB1 bacterium]MDZ7319763.1 hypothetical protein [candidate division KSB1 bacterium]MDZ7342232.1 hypothetical protein [candidate division KSB1 bacterium]
MTYQEKLAKFRWINEQSIIQHGLPWSRYLLMSADDPGRQQVQQQIIVESRIQYILKKLDHELAELDVPNQKAVDFQVYGSYYWRLRFLADIGLSGERYGIGPLIRKLALNQLEDGSFMIGYHARKCQTITMVCVTAQLAYCLSQLDGVVSRAFLAACDHLLATQRADGGWHCGSTPCMSKCRAERSSCFGATITALMALGQIPKKPWAAIQPAIDFCLRRLETVTKPYCDFDQPHAFCPNKLRYPPHHTGGDIINIIRSLSLFPDLVAPDVLQPLLAAVIERWDGHRWLAAEKEIPDWATFNFSQKGQPSDWLTALVLCAIKRIDSVSSI